MPIYTLTKKDTSKETIEAYYYEISPNGDITFFKLNGGNSIAILSCAKGTWLTVRMDKL